MISEKQAKDFIDIVEKIASSSADNSEETQKAMQSTIKFILEEVAATGTPGGSNYTNLNPTPSSVGGISAGSTFNNKTVSEMFDSLLYPYQNPSFNSFQATGIPGSGSYEVGYQIPAGSKIFSWGTNNSSNIDINTISILETFSMTSLLSASADDGTETLITSAFSKSTPGSANLYSISAINSEGSAISRSISGLWKGRWFYGTHSGTTITSAEIQALNTELTTGVVNKFKKLTPSGGPQYGYLIIPNYLAQPSDIKDSVAGCFGGNIPYSNIGTININNAYGIVQTYNIYRTTNAFNSPVNAWLCP